MRRIIPLCFLLASSSFAAQALAGSTPIVNLSYANLFDEFCAQQTKYKIDPAWVAEINTRLPEFRREWAKEGPLLLRTSEQIVGRKFKDREVAVSLSVCSMPSMGDPMLINMRYSLKSFIATPLPMDVTIGNIYHELLHRYLEGNIPGDSPLLLKYKSEDETVKAHLHLLALQEAVYLKLGRDSILRQIVEKDRSLPNKSYARAWDIVNNQEKYQSFVAELPH